jgi:hypothetical protein
MLVARLARLNYNCCFSRGRFCDFGKNIPVLRFLIKAANLRGKRRGWGRAEKPVGPILRAGADHLQRIAAPKTSGVVKLSLGRKKHVLLRAV